MGYIIFSSIADAEEYQAQADSQLGYPEPLDLFTQVGGGIHADPNIGRAYHYYPIEPNAAGDAWILPEVEGIEYSGSLVADIPSDWRV